MDEKKYDTVDIAEQEDMQVFFVATKRTAVFLIRKRELFSQQSFQKQAKKVRFRRGYRLASTIEQAW